MHAVRAMEAEEAGHLLILDVVTAGQPPGRLPAFHDPENVMHDVLNAHHWIRRQFHEAQTTDLERPPFRRP